MDGLTDTDRDTLVAALLTIPVIEPGARPQERVEVFATTLKEIRRRGGVEALWRGENTDD